MRLTVNEKTASVTSNAQGAIAIPADLLELIDVFYNDKPIDRVSLTYLRGLSPQSGTPACFAREGNQIVFFPTPTMQASDTLVINYFYRVPDLSESATTNDLFAKIPEMYLFGALSEAATFLDADSARWEQSYQAAFNRTVADDRAAEVAGSSAQVQSGY